MYRVPKDKEVLKMKVEFNKKGAERKELIKAISEILNTKPKYLGIATVSPKSSLCGSFTGSLGKSLSSA